VEKSLEIWNNGAMALQDNEKRDILKYIENGK
jgi:hypothetical protein